MVECRGFCLFDKRRARTLTKRFLSCLSGLRRIHSSTERVALSRLRGSPTLVEERGGVTDLLTFGGLRESGVPSI